MQHNLESLMSGIVKLDELLKNMRPVISEEEYVFCTVKSFILDDVEKLNPICTFKEDEGLTLILEKNIAQKYQFHFDEIFKKITLQIHSSLQAVGLTAAVSTALAEKGISANVVAAYYHDHIFVPANKANEALKTLQSLSQSS
jgi:hypothetical protein